MKINYKPTLLIIAMLTVSFAAFAQDFPDPGDGEPGTGDPGAPINSKLIWLAVAAIAFAYYTFASKKKLA